MTTRSSSVSGGCFCGYVRYRITGPLKEALFCHCESCRRSTGAPFTAWGRIQKTDFSLSRGNMTFYRSSLGVIRGFCNQCGSSVSYEHPDSQAELDFLLSTLDNPELLQPTYHVRVKEKLPWVEIGDDLPQYAGWRPKKNEAST